jgi:uncharacterized membrane protein YhfC
MVARIVLLCAVCTCSFVAGAQEFPGRAEGDFSGLPEDVQEWQFEAPPGGDFFGIMVVFEVEAGEARITLTNAAGEELLDDPWHGENAVLLKKIETLRSDPLTLRVESKTAAGSWQISIHPLPAEGRYSLLILGGLGMIFVGLAVIVGWWLRGEPQFRWFAAGAAIWTIGVAIKVGTAFLLTKNVLQWLELNLSHSLYVALGSIYVGVDSSLCEIGVTLIAVLLFRQMALTGNRAVAVGAGAGGFEAILLGLGGAVSASLAFSGVEQVQVAVGAATVNTPLIFVVGTVERVLAICAHIGTRTLVIYGVATRRWSAVLAGFLLFAALDGVAGWVHVSGTVHWINMWWIELMLVPISAVCLYAAWWCLKHWPAPPVLEERGHGSDEPAELV